MMELLVKAKHKQNKKWFFGVPMKIENKWMLLLDDEENILRAHFVEDKMWEAEIYAVEIDEKTICRPTGLTDKNGTKIWEWDVIKTHYANARKSEFVEAVVFHDGRFCAEQKNNASTIWAGLYTGVQHIPSDKSVYMDDVEVIGNIFDNQELLNGVEE